MKEILVITGIVALVLAIAASAFFWYTVTKPLYEPGMVRAEKSLRAPLTPPEQEDGANFWKVEKDIQLYHFSEGEGRPALVIHGGPGIPPAESWPGLTLLAGSYEFHYYHQRGCGRSSRPIDRLSSANTYENMQLLDKTLGLGAQVADIDRTRRILGNERLILIAHSFGAFLASLYAVEFPEHVEAMVLVSPANLLVLPQKDGDLFEAVSHRLPESMREEYAAYLKEYLDFQAIFTKSEADLAALNAAFAKYYGAVVEAPLPEQGDPGGWMVWAMYLSMGKQHDYRKALKAVHAPVLVIHGEDDLQPDSASRVYADLFPNAQFVMLEGAGHFSFHEQPAAFSAIVGEFLFLSQAVDEAEERLT